MQAQASAEAVPPTARELPQGLVRLEDWGVIRAAGADAAKFLHSQLTQDVEQLAAGQARLAGYCTAKGRLLATFVVWRRGPEELLLACSADVLPAVLKRLSMYVLRAKCKLGDASAELPLWGLAGDAAARALDALGVDAAAASWSQARVDTAGADVLRLPDAAAGAVAVPRWLWAGAQPPEGWDLPAVEPGAWRWLEAMSGVPRVVAATSEQFVPQMVNLEAVGGVNFRKGCYPGQEVVARSQYRGTIKRRARLFASSQALQPGQEVFHSEDAAQPAGAVVLAGSCGARHAALVEVKTAALAGGTLHAGGPGGALLEPLPLPYALPDTDSEAA